MDKEIMQTVINTCNQILSEQENEMQIKQHYVIEKDLSEPVMELGFDSMATVRLIILIEEKYDIEIPDNYLLFDSESTLEGLINIVTELVKK